MVTTRVPPRPGRAIAFTVRLHNRAQVLLGWGHLDKRPSRKEAP
jgi:hypothetical protein